MTTIRSLFGSSSSLLMLYSLHLPLSFTLPLTSSFLLLSQRCVAYIFGQDLHLTAMWNNLVVNRIRAAKAKDVIVSDGIDTPEGESKTPVSYKIVRNRYICGGTMMYILTLSPILACLGNILILTSLLFLNCLSPILSLTYLL